MKWLIIQSDGEHKGQDGWTRNDYLRECFALKWALEQNGQEADTWGLRHENFASPPDFNRYDAILCLENYEWNWLPDLSQLKALKIQWIIDLHCQAASAYARMTEQCDVILHSTRSLIKGYRQLYPFKKHLWFPNGVDSRYFDRNAYPIRNRNRNFMFIGSKIGDRAQVISNLGQSCGLEYAFLTGTDYIEGLLSTKIHLNMPIGVDWNYRNFETIGLGACLLTRENECAWDLGFRHGKNCLIYKTIDEIKPIFSDYLPTDRWQEIADNGYNFSRQHSYTNRIRDLLDQLRAGKVCVPAITCPDEF